MPRVRVENRIGPFRPIQFQAVPFRPAPIRALPLRPAPNLVAPVRPVLITSAAVRPVLTQAGLPVHPRVLTQQKLPVVAQNNRLLTTVAKQPPPVLNAPLGRQEFGREFGGEEEYEAGEAFGYTPTVVLDQYGRITRRLPTYRSAQYYPQQRTTSRVRPRYHHRH